MKKTLLFILSCSFTGLFAQNLDYKLTKSSESYTELSSPTIVTNNAWTTEHAFRMPFKFKFFEKSYDTLRISAAYGLSFSRLALGNSDIIFFGAETYFAENNNNALSPVSYVITGTTPDRIIKVEFKNFHALQTDPTEDYIVNNQIWLYETTNQIEFHFGPHTITDPLNNTTFYTGIIDFDNSPYLALEGTAASPTLVRVVNSLTFKGMSQHPAVGQVLTLTPVPKVSLNKLEKPYRFAQLPNGFQLQCETAENVGVYDLSGKLVETIPQVPGQMLQHEFADLAPGIYLINITINQLQFVEKILVQ